VHDPVDLADAVDRIDRSEQGGTGDGEQKGVDRGNVVVARGGADDEIRSGRCG
jgi:hypothetical protein